MTEPNLDYHIIKGLIQDISVLEGGLAVQQEVNHVVDTAIGVIYEKLVALEKKLGLDTPPSPPDEPPTQILH